MKIVRSIKVESKRDDVKSVSIHILRDSDGYYSCIETTLVGGISSESDDMGPVETEAEALVVAQDHLDAQE